MDCAAAFLGARGAKASLERHEDFYTECRDMSELVLLSAVAFTLLLLHVDSSIGDLAF
jgi:hypothetical protein